MTYDTCVQHDRGRRGVTMTERAVVRPSRLYEVPPPPKGDGEGNSPAAWTMYIVMLAGLVVAGLGIVLGSVAVVAAGAAVTVLGLVTGAVLRAAGFGLEGKRVRR